MITASQQRSRCAGSSIGRMAKGDAMTDRLLTVFWTGVACLILPPYVAWRFLTALVDGWEDICHGRVPPAFRGPVRRDDEVA